MAARGERSRSHVPPTQSREPNKTLQAGWCNLLQICKSAMAADPCGALVSRRSAPALNPGIGRRPIRLLFDEGGGLAVTHRAGLCHHRGKADQLTRQLVGSWVGSSWSKRRPSWVCRAALREFEFLLGRARRG